MLLNKNLEKKVNKNCLYNEEQTQILLQKKEEGNIKAIKGDF